RFLQANDRNQKELDLLREAIRKGKELRVVLRNYRKNGELFWNEVYLAPVRDDLGEVTHFIGVESDITLRKKMEDSLKDLTQQIIKIQEEERAKISREIHDDLGQSLATLKMHIQSSMKDSHKNKVQSKEGFQQTIEYINTIIDKTRNIAAGLRPSTLEVLGLIPSLRLLLKEVKRSKRMQINENFDVLEGIQFIGDPINIFRIVQEALTNIIKHTQADKIDIDVNCAHNELTLKIKDNGNGFVRLPKGYTGIGLATMKERAVLLGGELKIISESGQGTMIFLKVPITMIGEQNG
ncbi:MAG: sensor histidine kinase, partial [Candidatus Omnitrophica bacterium]|nr:sensor histidine kinase [Candidatus Omnitrophota bacterium]